MNITKSDIEKDVRLVEVDGEIGRVKSCSQ